MRCQWLHYSYTEWCHCRVYWWPRGFLEL